VEAAAAAAVGQPWQRNNARMSEMFRRQQLASRAPPPPRAAGVRAEEEAGALDALHELQRTESPARGVQQQPRRASLSPAKRARLASPVPASVLPSLPEEAASPEPCVADALIALTPSGAR